MISPASRYPAQTDVAADMAVVVGGAGAARAAVRDGREVLARLRVCPRRDGEGHRQGQGDGRFAARPLSLLDAIRASHRRHARDCRRRRRGRRCGTSRRSIEAAAVASMHDRNRRHEPTEVPTVSGVVSRLGAGDGVAVDTPDPALVDVSNVAKLTAMVQALRRFHAAGKLQLAATPETAAPHAIHESAVPSRRSCRNARRLIRSKLARARARSRSRVRAGTRRHRLGCPTRRPSEPRCYDMAGDRCRHRRFVSMPAPNRCRAAASTAAGAADPAAARTIRFAP